MRRSHEQGSRRGFWCSCVAVLLVGCLLYNPFLALLSHSDGLTYQAMARHRATVGASELQHYTPVPGDNAQADVIVAELSGEPPVDNYRYPAHMPQDEIFVPRVESTANMWFRPPPHALTPAKKAPK